MFPLNTVIAQYKTYYELMEYTNKHILVASRAHSQHKLLLVNGELDIVEGIRLHLAVVGIGDLLLLDSKAPTSTAAADQAKQ